MMESKHWGRTDKEWRKKENSCLVTSNHQLCAFLFQSAPCRLRQVGAETNQSTTKHTRLSGYCWKWERNLLNLVRRNHDSLLESGDARQYDLMWGQALVRPRTCDCHRLHTHKNVRQHNWGQGQEIQLTGRTSVSKSVSLQRWYCKEPMRHLGIPPNSCARCLCWEKSLEKVMLQCVMW